MPLYCTALIFERAEGRIERINRRLYTHLDKVQDTRISVDMLREFYHDGAQPQSAVVRNLLIKAALKEYLREDFESPCQFLKLAYESSSFAAHVRSYLKGGGKVSFHDPAFQALCYDIFTAHGINAIEWRQLRLVLLHAVVFGSMFQRFLSNPRFAFIEPEKNLKALMGSFCRGKGIDHGTPRNAMHCAFIGTFDMVVKEHLETCCGESRTQPNKATKHQDKAPSLFGNTRMLDEWRPPYTDKNQGKEKRVQWARVGDPMTLLTPTDKHWEAEKHTVGVKQTGNLFGCPNQDKDSSCSSKTQVIERKSPLPMDENQREAKRVRRVPDDYTRLSDI